MFCDCFDTFYDAVILKNDKLGGVAGRAVILDEFRRVENKSPKFCGRVAYNSVQTI